MLRTPLRTCDDPVFIVGAPRTASSFLFSALVESTAFAGTGEGHLLPLLNSLDEVTVGYYRMLDEQGLLSIPQNAVAQVPEEVMRHGLLDAFRGVTAMLYGNDRWVDKTVNSGMIAALPYLLEAWPRARVVYLRRNGIDNVRSAVAYFKVGFAECCQHWAQCGETWDRIRPTLPSERVIEIGHEQLLSNPAFVAEQLAEFLAVPAKPRRLLIERIDEGTQAWRRNHRSGSTLDSAGWSPQECRIFLRICGPQMVAQGYLGKTSLMACKSRYPEPDRIEIPAASALAIQVDDPAYFRAEGDSVFIVPGRSRAALLCYEQLPASGMHALEASLNVVHGNSQGVRFEFIGVCHRTGAFVFAESFEVTAHRVRNITLPFKVDCEQLDLTVRVVCGINAASNDYSWGHISNLCLSRQQAAKGTNRSHASATPPAPQRASHAKAPGAAAAQG